MNVDMSVKLLDVGQSIVETGFIYDPNSKGICGTSLRSCDIFDELIKACVCYTKDYLSDLTFDFVSFRNMISNVDYWEDYKYAKTVDGILECPFIIAFRDSGVDHRDFYDCRGADSYLAVYSIVFRKNSTDKVSLTLTREK